MHDVQGRSELKELTHKGFNYHLKDATQTQQQRPESPTVSLTCTQIHPHSEKDLSMSAVMHDYSSPQPQHQGGLRPSASLPPKT